MAVGVARGMVRSDTWRLYLECSRNGVVLDLTGAKLWFTAKVALSDADAAAVIQLDTATGAVANGEILIESPAANGKVTVKLNTAATSAVPDAGVTWFYDIQLKESTGVITTLETGTLRVEPDVTKATS